MAVIVNGIVQEMDIEDAIQLLETGIAEDVLEEDIVLLDIYQWN